MSIDYSQLAIPKGRTVKQQRAKAKRADAKALKAFRDACWTREHDRWFDPSIGQLAKCQQCETLVHPTMEPRGQVHHIVSRRHLSGRYDPANGEVLCRTCHNKRHGREF